MFLEIVNSVKEEPQFENNELVTTKAQKLLHGYGLKSVKKIIDKYDGIISYQVKDRVFVVNLTFFDMGAEFNEKERGKVSMEKRGSNNVCWKSN